MNISIYLAEELAGAAEAELHTAYSGRGMYGATCFGLSGSRVNLVAMGWRLCELNGENAIEDYEGVAFNSDNSICVDSFGLDRIYYWPSIQVLEEDDE
jgi:hypothetical protein